MIIGISGKIGSGKDTIGNMIQYLDYIDKGGIIDFKGWNIDPAWREVDYMHVDNNWEIKKYADALKGMVCLLIGCTREQLEDPDFKNKKLGEEWTRYSYAIGHGTKNGETTMWDMTCTKELYEEQRRINWQTAYKAELTPRRILQLLGTEAGREIIHPNIWVNALFSKYIPRKRNKWDNEKLQRVDCEGDFPNWIITDVRFPNEAEAIREREGILIRVNRNIVTEETKDGDMVTMTKHKGFNEREHSSETALDDYKHFNYIIDNNDSIESLFSAVQSIVRKENLIKQ